MVVWYSWHHIANYVHLITPDDKWLMKSMASSHVKIRVNLLHTWQPEVQWTLTVSIQPLWAYTKDFIYVLVMFWCIKTCEEESRKLILRLCILFKSLYQKFIITFSCFQLIHLTTNWLLSLFNFPANLVCFTIAHWIYGVRSWRINSTLMPRLHALIFYQQKGEILNKRYPSCRLPLWYIPPTDKQ